MILSKLLIREGSPRKTSMSEEQRVRIEDLPISGTVIPVDKDGNLVWINQLNTALDRFEKLIERVEALKETTE